MGIIMIKLTTKGFTLLELSVVILIIGLLIGGLLVGEEIVRAGKIRATLTEMDQMRMAFRLFKDKYGAPPGDFTRASEVFGCTAGTAPAGCNGNGDGGVNFNYTNAIGEGTEDLRAWQHLSLSGLLPGGFTGVVTVANQRDIGINVPKAKAKPGGYYTAWETFIEVWPNPVHAFTLGTFVNASNNFGSSRSSNDAKAMDLKVDDGVPLTGMFFIWAGETSGCFTGSGATSTYQVSRELNCAPRNIWFKDRG